MIPRKAAETAEKKIYKSSFVLFVAKKIHRIGMIPHKAAETAEEKLRNLLCAFAA